MIGRAIILEAQRESNAAGSDGVATMIDCDVEIAALNEAIVGMLAAYAERGMSAGEAATAAFASGFELGIRSARIHDRLLDGDPVV